MKIIDVDRYDLMKFITPGVSAEIGVATGRFSKIIVENNNPIELYLIDAWRNFDLGYADGNMVSDDKHEQRYQDVSNMFSENKSVKLVRDFSVNASHQFSDNFFDWIYVDADHSYEGCLNDLNAYNSKVKDTGYILGHDYTPPGGKTKRGFGVNAAVANFVKEHGYILSCITKESKFATYVISKNEAAHNALMDMLL
jgi:hypothetical protein